jgi:hypothetical protein
MRHGTSHFRPPVIIAGYMKPPHHPSIFANEKYIATRPAQFVLRGILEFFQSPIQPEDDSMIVFSANQAAAAGKTE